MENNNEYMETTLTFTEPDLTDYSDMDKSALKQMKPCYSTLEIFIILLILDFSCFFRKKTQTDVVTKIKAR